MLAARFLLPRFSSVRCFSDINSKFDEAQKKLNTLTEDPGNAAKLQIYGLFKQVDPFLLVFVKIN